MSLYFSSQGHGDEGESVRTPDGRELKRLKALNTRDYLSIFGEFELPRIVYGGEYVARKSLFNRLWYARDRLYLQIVPRRA